MNLFAAIQTYEQYRRDNGETFESGCKNLQLFGRLCGDIPIAKLNHHHIRRLLDRPEVSSTRIRELHVHAADFCEYWFARSELARFPMPPKPAKSKQVFTPYVFSQDEIKRLLQATQSDIPMQAVAKNTVRALLLTMYSTGAGVTEMLTLAADDVDSDSGHITFRSTKFSRFRRIPVPRHLHLHLKGYEEWKRAAGVDSSFYFPKYSGKGLTSRSIGGPFDRLRRYAGVLRSSPSSYEPRLYDLRVTFAVHRITAWIKAGADLNRRLPALAAYMGHAGINATERYLHLVPERFRGAVEKLSPGGTPRKKWRDDPELIRFLQAL